MKKVIYALSVVALILVVSCSDEDKLPSVNYTGCQVCEVDGVAPDYVPEDYEICTALHTFEMDTTLTDTIDNPVTLTYETVYVDGADTGLSATDYFSLFCDNAYDPNAGSGNNVNCVTCAAYTDTNTSTQVPEQEICMGDNGNAYIGTSDQGIPFTQFVASRAAVTTCE